MKLKYFLIPFFMVLFITSAFGQKYWSMRAGFGQQEIMPDVNRNRYLLGAIGGMDFPLNDRTVFSVLADGEVSYSTAKDDVSEASAWGVILDLYPKLSREVIPGLKPGLGIGISGMASEQNGSSDNYTSYDETVLTSGGYGLVCQPDLMFEGRSWFLKGALKYRLLTYETHWDVKSDGEWSEEQKRDLTYTAQSWDAALSVGLTTTPVWVELGVQFENWLLKHEDEKRWSKWPEDWELLFFLRLTGTFD